jgi:hypothetical protein
MKDPLQHQTEADPDRLINFANCFSIESAEAPVKPAPVNCPDLIKERHRGNRKAGEIGREKDVHGRERHADARRKRRDDRRHGSLVSDVVLNDEGGPRLPDFVSYRRIERREVDFAALREGLAAFSWSSR